jgi:hypothetical protein
MSCESNPVADYSEENFGFLKIPRGLMAKEDSRELISLISKGKIVIVFLICIRNYLLSLLFNG